ncbi:antA/AntB antirepressor family protein [Fibrella sp. ES10-3-2-2]|nr:hypothetical protein A6C57_06995 [Fibrella sp. ES10-3-2-2]
METKQSYSPSADQSTPPGQTGNSPVTTTPIQITTDAKGTSVVSARELYESLGFEAVNWSRWAKKNIQSNPFAIHGTDWEQLFTMKSRGNGAQVEAKDYALTLAFAERLSMLARTEKGEEVRRWFQAIRDKALAASKAALPVTDPALLQILNTQTQLLAGQQQQIDQLRTSQQNQIDQLRADMAAIQSGKRPRRYKPVPPLPGVRTLFPEPSRDKQLRSEIHRIVNEYCERITSATQADTYKYLYDRMQPVYGLNVYRLGRWGNESLLDAIERHGYLNQLYHLALGNLANVG